ncbi:MAG: citrate synthase [Clostridia bacterium]|nr:citrate synthase [Clostridia bacterium]
MHTHNEINNILNNYTDLCVSNTTTEPSLYEKYDVKRGLRDVNGVGVLTGLTGISDVRNEGQLLYRGIDIKDMVAGFAKEKRYGFEEVIYLLLMGKQPTADQLKEFKSILSEYRILPRNFVRDVVLKAPTADIMNALAREVLTLYSYDKAQEDISLPNVMRQCLQLISVFPQLAVYSYHSYNYKKKGKSLIIHITDPNRSIAEDILALLRSDEQYTPLEAQVLDTALVLHAEHGGGNNSTFTTRVVSSTGTDTYSAMAASLCSLKGPKHGGASLKVMEMFENIRKNVDNWNDEEEIRAYLSKMLDKQAFDRTGLIYGVGHAVYSKADPRAEVFRSCVESLAREKGKTKDYKLYRNVEKHAIDLISQKRRIYKGVVTNVDFYSGFAYSMLGLPKELYIPIFATSRLAGWSAHRMEELINASKIIRPAYHTTCEEQNYIPLAER